MFSPMNNGPEYDDDLAEFFGEEPAKPKQKSRIRGKLIDDIFVERVLQGEPVMNINRELGRHPTSGPPQTEYYRKRLAQRQNQLMKKEEITTDRIIAEMAKLAFLDPRTFYDNNGKPIPIQELSDDSAAALAGIEVHKLGKEQEWAEVVKYKLADKLNALNALGRAFNLFEKDNNRKLDVNLKDISATERARRVAFVLQEAMRARENVDKTDE